ncbi:hypothetical protein WME95_36845 [Sorangium sp. So ce327]|jgi:hypothetical protein|uniref:hypothetical protein n=1 Tax=unclassified Sorangium TaxID=2621164 RepID=UPI003F63734F
MIHRRGITCQITAYEVPDPPSDPDARGRKWLAIATAHVYDPNIELPGLKPGQAALVGETMRVFNGRAAADTEAQAMAAALQALLFELTAKGFSANHDVKLW